MTISYQDSQGLQQYRIVSPFCYMSTGGLLHVFTWAHSTPQRQNPAYNPPKQWSPAYSPGWLLNTVPGLTQLWVHSKALPVQRARPVTSTKGRTQPMELDHWLIITRSMEHNQSEHNYLIAKPRLQPWSTLGHSLITHLSMKPAV